MVRLYVFVEGQTEQTFADDLLKPHLAGFGVFIQGPILIAHAKKKGKIHRGGGRNYLPMKNDIRRFLAQEKGGNVFFTTMIDLYAIHADFPGLTDAEQFRHSPDERIRALERAFAEDIGDPRFVPYIQLHEYESYLFVDPARFADFYDGHERQIDALRAIADEYPTPEWIDDGEHSAPSKRIIGLFPDYGDAKATVGPQIAGRIGLGAIRARCLHFAAWLARLEKLDEETR